MKKNNLTLLLVLKGRHDFTDRWLAYANIFLSDYEIIIADGSEINNKYILDRTKYKNLEINTPDFPYDENIEFFLKKIKKSLEIVKSEYVLYCENDDLMVPEEIKNVLTFLVKNKDYVSGRGEIFNFSISSINELYGKIIEFKRFNNFLNLNENDVFDRLSSFGRNKHGLYHNITKTSVIKKMLDGAINNKFYDLVIFQYYWNFFIPIVGKIYCSKNLYMLHQDHLNMISRNSNIMSFDKSLFYNQNYFDSFFLKLAEEIKNLHNIELDKAGLKLFKIFSYNELLNLIRSNQKNYSLKSKIINIIRSFKITNYLLNYKKRFVIDNNQLFRKELSPIKDFLKK